MIRIYLPKIDYHLDMYQTGEFVIILIILII